MGTLDSVVSVTVTSATASPTKDGFGTPMIVGYHTVGSARSRLYTKPADMLTDGFTVNDQVYKAAAIMCSQPNRPSSFKIGRCAGAPAQSVTLVLQAANAGEVYSVDITDAAGVTTTCTRTSTAVVATDATALAATIDALSLITASSGGTATITVLTTAAGSTTTFANWSSNMHFSCTTPDPATGIATDLAAIYAEDSDWYGLVLAHPSEAIVNAAAAWAGTNVKLLGYATSDWGCTDVSTTTDIMSDLKGAAYTHTFGIYSGKKFPSYADAAWMGNRFPYLPGGTTWQFKTLTGVSADNLTAAQKSSIAGKNGSYYVTLAGLNMTLGGSKVASGEYIDVIHFLDWQINEIQYRVFTLLVNNNKVPFDDTGISVIQSAVSSALQAGVDAGGLTKNPAFVVTVPKAVNVSTADKTTRTLNNVTFTATLAGAIHLVNVTGTVSA